MKKFDFAKSYKELEEIAAKFERGDLSLEEGLKNSSKALSLRRNARNILNKWRIKLLR